MKREEYLDDYQDHAERRPKKKKKKKKRKHRVYAFFVLLFAFLILVLGIFILFHVQKVEVKGNDYCSTEEIVKSVQNDKYSVNGLYVLAKYKLGYGKQPDCFESIKVSLKNPWTLKITVQEKERIGYVMDSDGKYYYFDQDGMVIDVEEAPVDGIPLVDGIDPDELKLYHKLKKKSSIIYQEILEATREMKKYELSVTKIMCRSDRIYVYIGNVCVSLGNDVTSVKVAQIPKILEKLEGKEGTLHLENFSDESDTATFDIGVFPEDAG